MADPSQHSPPLTVHFPCLATQAMKFEAPVTLTCSGGAATGASTLTVPGVSFYKTTIAENANQKQCQYGLKGSFYNGACQIYHRVREICIKLGLEQGRWALNTTWGGAGCHWREGWNVPSFKQQAGSEVSFGHGLPPHGAVNLAGLKVRVRSGLDPYVDAEELTQGSDDFGSTKGDLLMLGLLLEAPWHPEQDMRLDPES